jgi:hypothetical protein
VSELRWNWLCVPYVVCSLLMLVVAITTALVRGDRVMRIGVVGAATTTLPWSICTALAVCADSPDMATRLLRVGSGPVALIGPNLMLVLLGVSGQLERNRWIARVAYLVGVVLLAFAWGSDLVIPGVQRLPSGMYYAVAGPLTDVHWSQLAVWLTVGVVIMRRGTTSGEKRKISRLLVAWARSTCSRCTACGACTPSRGSRRASPASSRCTSWSRPTSCARRASIGTCSRRSSGSRPRAWWSASPRT